MENFKDTYGKQTSLYNNDKEIKKELLNIYIIDY